MSLCLNDEPGETLGGDEEHEDPLGGWGPAPASASILFQEHAVVRGSRILMHQNKPEGLACVSCSWAKPAHPHVVEACDNGIKATAWEITSKRTPTEFFAEHTVSELLTWSDHELEEQGRLTDPLRWDPGTDKYLPVPWSEAFDAIGQELKTLAPKSVVFYASGRASLETAYLYQLFARPVRLQQFVRQLEHVSRKHVRSASPNHWSAHRDCDTGRFRGNGLHFLFWSERRHQQPSHVAPVAGCTTAQSADRDFNPLRERGLVSFVNLLSPLQMPSPGRWEG